MTETDDKLLKQFFGEQKQVNRRQRIQPPRHA